MSTTSSEAPTRTGPISGVDLSVYLTRDPQRAIAFYRDVLGMTPTAVDDAGRGAEFTLGDGSTFGVWQPDGADALSGAAMMFAVPDIHHALAEVRERGGTFSEPDETPSCFMSFGSDPDGNSVFLHQRKVP